MKRALSTLLLTLSLALPFAPAADANCVRYVQSHSGFGLQGDAWRWWQAAAGRYQRGQRPTQGAVLVFKQLPKMRSGHVALVHKVVGKREILIDHANWTPSRRGRGKVDESVRVVDVSPANDWSEVRVWYPPTKQLGVKVYPTYGFILPG